MTQRGSDGTAPLVSILTPSFGQARWLAENLASVERQTFGNIELDVRRRATGQPGVSSSGNR